MIFPTGEGMGATQLGCVVRSPRRAAGMAWMMTVADALRTMPGPAGTQGTSVHGLVLSVIRAAGGPPIIVFIAPEIMGSGNAG